MHTWMRQHVMDWISTYVDIYKGSISLSDALGMNANN